MNLSYFQNGILKWFWLTPNESKHYSIIKRKCEDLEFGELTYRKGSAFYRIFWPLVRLGLIESYSNGKFSLSPTTIIKNSDFVILINYPGDILNQSCNIFKFELLYRFFRIPKLEFDKLYNSLNRTIKLDTFNFDIIEQFDLSKIIYQWDKTVSFNSAGMLQYSKKLTWENDWQDKEVGIFKAKDTVFSTKYLKVDQNRIFVIPNKDKNIDGFSLAILFCHIYGDIKLDIIYNKELEILKVNSQRFPCIIERLLVINSLLHGVDFNTVLQKKYYINASDFNKFKCIFQNNNL